MISASTNCGENLPDNLLLFRPKRKRMQFRPFFCDAANRLPREQGALLLKARGRGGEEGRAKGTRGISILETLSTINCCAHPLFFTISDSKTIETKLDGTVGRKKHVRKQRVASVCCFYSFKKIKKDYDFDVAKSRRNKFPRKSQFSYIFPRSTRSTIHSLCNLSDEKKEEKKRRKEIKKKGTFLIL